MWCRGINWTVGLEVQELIYRLRSFVDTFDEMGAQLVFFVGGLTPPRKRKTWLRCRIRSIHKMLDVCDILYSNKTYEDIPESLDSIPPNMENFVAFVLKHVLNCMVSITVFFQLLCSCLLIVVAQVTIITKFTVYCIIFCSYMVMKAFFNLLELVLILVFILKLEIPRVYFGIFVALVKS